MTSRLVVAIRIAAPPARVFEVFTRDIALWWQPSSMFPFTPRAPGVLRFEGEAGGRLVEERAGGKLFEVGRITAWEPPQEGEGRLVFGWRQATFAPDQNTEVTVRFEPLASLTGAPQTRVTVEHRGWDSLPQSHLARHGWPLTLFQRRHAEWWQAGLASLRRTITP